MNLEEKRTILVVLLPSGLSICHLLLSRAYLYFYFLSDTCPSAVCDVSCQPILLLFLELYLDSSPVVCVPVCHMVMSLTGHISPEHLPVFSLFFITIALKEEIF